MKSTLIPRVTPALIAVIALAGLAGSPAVFADHHEADDDASMAPTSGFRAEFLRDMATVEKKVMGLAEAIPASAYSWGPAPTVRDTAASFIHMAQANHQILQALGFSAPENVGDMESEIRAKADVQAALEASFAAVRKAVLATPDSELDTMVPFFGGEWSKRQVLSLVAGHCHEHLGQAIVYARSMGVVPPWSRQQSAANDDEDG